MKLAVDDLITRRREIRIPSECPRCGSSLMREGSIKVWEYQDQSRLAHLTQPRCDGLAGLPIEFENDLPQQGESWLILSYECMKCGKRLAAARSEELCSESLGQEMEDYYKMRGEKHALVQKLKSMRDAVEMALRTEVEDGP